MVLGAEDYESEVRFSGQRAVFMGILVLPNANSLDVIKRVRTEMDAIQKDLPTGWRAASPTTAPIHQHRDPGSLQDPRRNAAHRRASSFSCSSVRWRSVIVPLVAIPISLIGAVFLMQVFGFTLNLLTLLAIVLSVGLVVDDAIVMVENVERHVREGHDAAESRAARRARAGRADHRHDDHAGGGIHPDRHSGRADGFVLPRVRLHAGRRGRSFPAWWRSRFRRSCPQNCCAQGDESAVSPPRQSFL